MYNNLSHCFLIREMTRGNIVIFYYNNIIGQNRHKMHTPVRLKKTFHIYMENFIPRTYIFQRYWRRKADFIVENMWCSWQSQTGRKAI